MLQKQYFTFLEIDETFKPNLWALSFSLSRLTYKNTGGTKKQNNKKKKTNKKKNPTCIKKSKQKVQKAETMVHR